jgi:hypothetical protein
MKREQEYRHLADDVFKRGAEELNAQLKAQWEILVADIWNSQISRKQLTRTKRSMIRSHGTGSGKNGNDTRTRYRPIRANYLFAGLESSASIATNSMRCSFFVFASRVSNSCLAF